MGPPSWPADADALAAGEAWLRQLPAGATVAVASDSDTDGLCAGAIALAALERLGHRPRWLLAGRGEHPHSDSMRARISALDPDALVVLDMGSRAGAIVAGLPTLVLDHHAPSGSPDGALLLSAYGHPPVAPTSLLAYHFFQRLVPVDDLEWLGVLGAHADRGDAALPGLAEGLARHGKTAISQASALLNASRRAPDPEPEVAGAVIRAARCATDITRGRVPCVDRLREHRSAVNAELGRCGRAAPRFAGELALIRIRSRAQIHPLLATRWAKRLARYVVLVANDGYLPGRVNFSMRTERDLDLVQLLRRLELELGPEFAHGHPGATGGSVTPEDFERLLERFGFREAADRP